MRARRSLVPLLKFLGVFITIGLLSLYFRTYGVHGGPLLSFRSSHSIARDLVGRAMRTQIQNAIEKSEPRISPQERERLASVQAERLKLENKESYEQAVLNTARDIEKRRHARPRYLLEADPYHYLHQTERLLEGDRTARVRKAGQCFYPLMRAPHGYWGPCSVHPYVGLGGYRIIHAIDPSFSLLEAVAYVPLILTLLVLLLFGGLGRVLHFPLPAHAVGMMTLALSPIYIQRSALGWFDTDPYNYLFPIAILIFVFGGMRERKKEFGGALGAAFFTGAYALFWTGWPFMMILIPGCLMASAFFIRWVTDRRCPENVPRVRLFVGTYLAATLLFLAFFLTPAGLVRSLQMGWSILNKFALAEWDIWPNVFLTVGEASGIGLKKLIFLTGNYFTFALALAGLLLEGERVFRRGNASDRFRYVFLILFSVPVFLMSLKTERFSVLFVLPLAIFAGYGVTGILEAFRGLERLKELLPFFAGEALRRRTALTLIFLFFVPPIFLLAHVVSVGIQPIMDDVWNDALLELRAKTPENAIVNSWWPPGYFVTGVAQRAVIADGGTQHFRETYWMSRALMAEDELEAAGIIRMLDLSGGEALEQLLDQGMEVADAVDLILKIVPRGRQAAFEVLPVSMSAEQKNALLEKTHGQGGVPPAYLLIYNDLIEQNLAVSVMARWDFRKAKALGEKKRRRSAGLLGILGQDAGGSYVRELLSVSGPLLKYTAAAPMVGRSGDQLTFKNGVRVDLATQEAWVDLPPGGQPVRPSHFFYVRQGNLVEKAYHDGGVNTAVLHFKDAGNDYAVLADVRLVRSLLFRLYYLKGQGLTLFKPLVEKGSFSGGTVVQVFELERQNLP